jgi:hypothetical protein
MTEEELAKWVTEQINSPLEAMELPDEQDEGERA